MIRLGEKAKDSITGFTGVIVAITEWLHGCRRVALQCMELKDGKPLEPEWFDEQRLTDEPIATTGGPMNDPVSRKDPSR